VYKRQLLKTKTGTALYVAAINRDAQGLPTGIYSPRRVDLGLGTLKSVSWSGANSLAVIGTGQTTGDVPTNILVGGGSSEMTALTDAVAMIAQTDSSSTYVLDGNGILFEYRGMSWIAVETEVKTAHFTGN
jgi:hypothetical protein